MRAFFLTSLLAFASHSTAQIDPAFAAAHSCNEKCQQVLQTGISFELSQHAFADDPFYKAPFPEGRPKSAGEIVRLEKFTDIKNYSIPSSQSMSRFVYTTETANGTIIPASAYILWPHTPYLSPNKPYDSKAGIKFKTVLWSHGTTGINHNCAPSNYQHLQYNWMMPFEIAAQGFAVVAPDYAGLGVDTDFDGNHIYHPYTLGLAQANDMAFALQAARKAFPDQLEEDFVTIGHSQGGGVAWAFAQRQAEKERAVSGYLGTIAFSPPADILAQARAAFVNVTDPAYTATLTSSGPYVVAGITAAYPDFDYFGMTEEARDLFQVVQNGGGCLVTTSLQASLLKSLPLNQEWLDHPTALEFFEMARNGGKPFKGPLMIVTSTGDFGIPIKHVEDGFNDTCDLMAKSNDLKNESLELLALEKLGHFDLIQGSRSRWIEWVKARFEGKNVRPGCSRDDVPAFNVENTVIGLAPNWIHSRVDPATPWKAAF